MFSDLPDIRDHWDEDIGRNWMIGTMVGGRCIPVWDCEGKRYKEVLLVN